MIGSVHLREREVKRPTSPRQSRALSLVEAVTNVAAGFIVALMTQMVLFPAVGIKVPFDRHLLIGLAFTLVSVARSYLLRRLFERLGRGEIGSHSTQGGDDLRSVHPGPARRHAPD